MPVELPHLTPTGDNRAQVGIVHLGLGAFFRAHGAVYIAEAMAKSGGNWGITGVSLQSPTMRDLLAPQGFAYSAVELGPDGEKAQDIEVISDIRVAREDPAAVVALMANPAIKIVTLTVTEKGYCHSPATGTLNVDHPDIAHDLTHDLPVSAPGFLVRALQARFRAGVAPFTVLTCDNLPENGKVVRGVVLELAGLIDPDLADWIATTGAFPATMVDRIVPATKPDDVTRLATQRGVYDAAPVLHEPFRQWVVEDRFVNNDRPDLGAVGVQMVADVTPYEHMKLRMLNGTHSSLAYLGYLAGFDTIADCMAISVIRRFVRHLWQVEIIPSLTPPKGEDLTAYSDALFQRYANPTIRHRTWQIAMDGSQKLPQRILDTLAENLAAGRPCDGLILAVAAWMRYVGGTDEAGQPIDVKDPLAARLRRLSHGAEGDAAKVAALLSVREIFPADLAVALQSDLTHTYKNLRQRGAKSAIREVLE